MTTTTPTSRRLVAATLLASAAMFGSLLFNAAPAMARPPRPNPTPAKPPPTMCYMAWSNGSGFYLPGETYTSGDGAQTVTCGDDGKWRV